MHEAKSFEAVFERLLRTTGARSDSALARALNIKPQSVVAAKKRRQIPPGWLVFVAQEYGVSTDWLFFGATAQKKAAPPGAAQNPLSRPADAGPELELRLAEQAKRICELEQQLAAAKDDALKAYRLAVEAMRAPVDTVQVPPPPPYGNPAKNKPEHNDNKR